jgi:hypothetical protein
MRLELNYLTVRVRKNRGANLTATKICTMLFDLIFQDLVSDGMPHPSFPNNLFSREIMSVYNSFIADHL